MSTALQLTNTVLLQVDYQKGSVTTITEDLMSQRALAALNMAYEEIVNHCHFWSWREVTNTLSLVIGTTDYTLPTTVDIDTIKDVRDSSTDENLIYVPSSEFYRLKESLLQVSSGGSEYPRYYTLEDSKLKLLYTADTAGTLKYQAQLVYTALAVDGDEPIIPQKYQNVLTLGGVYYLKLFLGDQDQDKQYLLFQKGLTRMLTHNKRYGGHVQGMRLED